MTDNRVPFNGITIDDLKPLSHAEVSNRGRNTTTKVVRNNWDFPLDVGSIVFDAGTLLTFGDPHISYAAIVIKGLQTKTRVIILETNPDHHCYWKVGETVWLSSRNVWVRKKGVPKYTKI